MKKLIYVYDALCGWCYGFSPVISHIHESYKDKLEFEVISGGMVTGEQAGPLSMMADYIKNAYRDVERTTGITFGKPFIKDLLEEGTAHFSSMKPASALSVIKRDKPEVQIPFAKALQEMIYKDGQPPHRIESYRPLALEFDQEPKYFMDSMMSDEIQRETMQDFIKTQQLGVNGFPTLFLEDESDLHQITRGFARTPDVVMEIERLL